MTTNIPISKDLIINPESTIKYASSVGVGEDGNEIRLIIINKRLINKNDELEMINESDLQVILNRNTAIELKNILNQYLNE